MHAPRDTSAFRLPQPPAPPIQPGSFAQCPAALLEGLSETERAEMAELYQRALREAQAVVQKSLPERDLLGNPN
jgi:hypothetical protein